jgi:hypothetical protein
MTKLQVDLFTEDEHGVIAAWLSTKPLCELGQDWSLDDALMRLGFDMEASERSREQAAVASIVLEGIQDQLPRWGSYRQTDDGETHVTLGRDIQERRAPRKVELVPQYLMTINWADSGPGFSWPVAYHVTWLPLYDRFVVTESADSPDMYGYCDFAIAHFAQTDDHIGEAARQIVAEWQHVYNSFEQSRWANLFWEGLISNQQAEKMADEVWPDE